MLSPHIAPNGGFQMRNAFHAALAVLAAALIAGEAAAQMNLRGETENSRSYREWRDPAAQERAEKQRQWNAWAARRKNTTSGYNPEYRGPQDSRTGPISMLPPGMEPPSYWGKLVKRLKTAWASCCAWQGFLPANSSDRSA